MKRAQRDGSRKHQKHYAEGKEKARKMRKIKKRQRTREERNGEFQICQSRRTVVGLQWKADGARKIR